MPMNGSIKHNSEFLGMQIACSEEAARTTCTPFSSLLVYDHSQENNEVKV